MPEAEKSLAPIGCRCMLIPIPAAGSKRLTINVDRRDSDSAQMSAPAESVSEAPTPSIC